VGADGGDEFISVGPGFDGATLTWDSASLSGLTSKVRFESGNLGGWDTTPGATDAGSLYQVDDVFDTGIVFYCDGTNWRPLTPAHLAHLPTARSRTNRSDEIYIWDTTVDCVGAGTMPIDFLKVGDYMRLIAGGGVDHGAFADDFVFRWYLGSNNLNASMTFTADAVARTDKEWRIETICRVRTTGGSGSMFSNSIGWHTLDDAGSVARTRLQGGAGSTGATISTTTANKIQLTVQMSAARAANVVNINYASAEMLHKNAA
jgi:hypothetical protein